jgi:uncharacterized membrane protein HdeD (DUF308 family)
VEVNGMTTAAPPFESKSGPMKRLLARPLLPWWLLLITGMAWVLVGFSLLRFDYTSVYPISLLFGFVAIAAGALEIWMTFMAAAGGSS